MSMPNLTTCFICERQLLYNRPYRATCSPECHEKMIEQLEQEFGTDKKVARTSTGEEFRVPLRDIVEKGIKERDLDQYPKW